MKSSIPSTFASIRELLLASGGPWWSWMASAWLVIRPPPPRARTITCSTGRPLSERRRPTRSRRSQPERAPGNVETMISSVRSSRIACIAAVKGSGCAIWPWTSMPSARSSESAARRRRSASGCSERDGSLCGSDDEEAGAPLLRAGANALEERLAEDGLVGHDEDVRAGATGDVADDVLDRPSAGSPADLLEQVLAEPSRSRLGMRGDDDLVDVLRGEHIPDSGHRIVVEHRAVRRDTGFAQSFERPVETTAGRSASRVSVDDVARRVAACTGATTMHANRARAPLCASPRSRARRRRASRWRRRGSAACDAVMRAPPPAPPATPWPGSSRRDGRRAPRTRTARRRPAGSRRS